ncbi:DNA adenine methylase [Leptolyngbya iicbica]|uniref:Site-specific DNA-methyltransferase (adenine-specific) n=2 Tax=Cyanophyceae TaxID=3028117 RepID=A0A4Q7E617_9CYAN|nr:DNA adenine methylase [Leptolyngbya sp. LK]RZM77802.1 DNA adenine methylase [Leptolyngbya sp. LK]
MARNFRQLSLLPVSPRPFVKWAGGKGQLLPELVARVPQQFNRYFEPFLGGAALFFHLQPQQAVLSDSNPDLINLYRVIRDQVEELIEDLGRHVYDREYYYRLRQVDRTPEYGQWTVVQRASRFIYLNKTCYNGLYRVNSRGEFNVPFGRYKNPTILDEENLRACHAALQGVTVKCRDFRETCRQLGEGDFVYFDPPYMPVSTTASFTGYTREGFGERMQEKLASLCRELDRRGVRFMASNSDTPLMRELYQGFNVEVVYAARPINSQGRKRGRVPEVVVRN